MDECGESYRKIPETDASNCRYRRNGKEGDACRPPYFLIPDCSVCLVQLGTPYDNVQGGLAAHNQHCSAIEQRRRVDFARSVEAWSNRERSGHGIVELRIGNGRALQAAGGV